MDARKERSRAAVLSAFFELLAEKDYGKITVQDLLERASVGRATFYAQFRGKDDVLAAAVSELCAQALADDDPSMDTKAQVAHAFANLWERRACVKTLVSGAGAQPFADCLRHAAVARAARAVPEYPSGPAAQIDRDFLLHHIAAAFVGSVQWWAWHGFTATPDEVAEDFLCAVLPLFSPAADES